MTTLRVHEVCKRFGRTVAVDRVSFDLGEREVLVLVGPSGCGKSTVLRMIAGLHTVDSGEIELGGVTVSSTTASMPPERRGVGLVFQEHALFPHLSVAANVGFGVRRGDKHAQVDAMLQLVGLAGLGGRYPHELSGGERQRVALARALAPEPHLLLLDEPFASLDPNLRTRLRDDVVAILRATGTPAVFVTHDQGEALAVGDRIAVMRSGSIEQIGTPEDVYHQPVDHFVASFMGEAAFVPVKVVVDNIEGVPPVVGAEHDDLLMLRPDDVTFEVDDAGAARVTAAEFRGSTWCYRLTLPSSHEVLSMRTHLDRVDVGAAVNPRLRVGHRPVVVKPPADD